MVVVEFLQMFIFLSVLFNITCMYFNICVYVYIHIYIYMYTEAAYIYIYKGEDSRILADVYMRRGKK